MAAELAAKFSPATANYLSRASNASLQTGDIDFTVTGWVYNDTQANGRLYITKGRGFAVHEYSLFNSSGALYNYRIDNKANTINTVASLSGAWEFVVFWHDAAANTTSFQKNNGTVTTKGYGGGVTVTADPFNLGGASARQSHDGRMQGVSFHKRTLTTAERTWLFNSGAGRHYDEYGVAGAGASIKTNLISHWLLNEASGTTRNDSHGTNHLTDNNTVTTAPGIIVKPVAGSGKTSQKRVHYLGFQIFQPQFVITTVSVYVAKDGIVVDTGYFEPVAGTGVFEPVAGVGYFEPVTTSGRL